jgi:rhodanese-related sulfurtransferase
MSKNRKHHASPVGANRQAASPATRSTSTPVRCPTRRIVWQLLAIVGVSSVLGFAFNASSPVGVRFASDVSTTTLTHPVSVPSVVVPTNQVALLPPSPPQPVEKPAVKPAIIPAPTPILLPAQVSTPPTPPPTPVKLSQVAATSAVAATTTPANLNPAPIHWAEAKPLVAAGQAILVDVRAKGMYDAGHIPGAFSLPEASPPEEFTAFLNQHPTNLTLVVYCSSVSCSQSARVAARLVTQYQRPVVKYMTGGYQEYQQEQARSQVGTTP